MTYDGWGVGAGGVVRDATPWMLPRQGLRDLGFRKARFFLFGLCAGIVPALPSTMTP